MREFRTNSADRGSPPDTDPDGPTDEHSLGRSVVLHLAPGVPVLAAILLGTPVAAALGLPAVAAAFAAVLLVLVPVQLGYLLYRARREGVGLRRLLRFREVPPPRRFAAVLAAVLAVQVLVFVVLWGPLEELLRSQLFRWLPELFFRADDQDPAAFSGTALAVTWVLGLVANGVVGPVVEELYFRAYLLPRLGRLGRLAPAFNAFLFSAYHLFAPWQLISRFLFALPFVHAVWRTRSTALGIAAHVANNVTAMVLLLLAYLAAAG